MSTSYSIPTDIASPKDDDERKRAIPRWLPVALLAGTTLALSVPVVLLWRQKRSLGSFKSANGVAGAAPPRRASSRPIGTTSNAMPSTSSATARNSIAPPPRRMQGKGTGVTIPTSSAVRPTTTAAKAGAEDTSSSAGFSDPLMAAGSFGLATAAVTVAAAAGIWGVKYSLDVKNTEQFAAKMRYLMQTRLSFLFARIHGLPNVPEPDPPLEVSERDDHRERKSVGSSEPWTWQDAEVRLREAFDRGGITEWARAAHREIEEEHRAESEKRGLR